MPYGDLRGKCYMDFHTGSSELSLAAHEMKIKTARMSFIGIRFSAGENSEHLERPPKIQVHFLAISDEAWRGTYETVGEYLEQEEKIRVIEYPTKLSLTDFFNQYLKRFWGTLVCEGLTEKKLDVRLSGE